MLLTRESVVLAAAVAWRGVSGPRVPPKDRDQELGATEDACSVGSVHQPAALAGPRAVRSEVLDPTDVDLMGAAGE